MTKRARRIRAWVVLVSCVAFAEMLGRFHAPLPSKIAFLLASFIVGGFIGRDL